MPAPTPIVDDASLVSSEARPHLSRTGYQSLQRSVVLATSTVAVVPLVLLTLFSLYQSTQTRHNEAIHSVTRLATNNKRSLEFFLAERRSALKYIIRDRTFEELCSADALARIIVNLNQSFAFGAFVDLEIIDSRGEQRCYEGPYELGDRDYHEQDWFHNVARRGFYTSDVFMGFRKSPHFVIASRHEWKERDFYILRATIDADMLAEQLLTAGLGRNDDIFLINRAGVLQTVSRRYGEALNDVTISLPHFSPGVEVHEDRDENGRAVYVGSAYITDSPFILMYVKPVVSGYGTWLPLVAFLAISAALILAVVFWGARQFVGNIRQASLRRAAMMHKVEYNNKLASVGRLAAGVAHEINNPLAIINEKSGLLKDIVTLHKGDFPKRDKILSLVDSVLSSVERCKKITHRLLGFAKHMDLQHEAIDVPSLLKEVIGFLEKEAEYRNIRVSFDSHDNIPTLESDRGQLQQVFLNVINNAIAAVQEGGHVDVAVGAVEGRAITVAISDDGVGIPKANLERIFEPFFTTKEGSGTGLGLSITYGIVRKLGGDISVESEVGAGTRFTISLPLSMGG